MRPVVTVGIHAGALLRAYHTRQPVAADPGSGPADAAAAYAVQEEVWRSMVGAKRPTAWKVGAPHPDDTPLAAPIFPPRLGASPARFPRDSFVRLGIEAEIALRFNRDLPARREPYGREEILAAIGSAHVAMELVDSRLADPDAAGPLWRLADNLLDAGLVLGDALPHWRDLDLGGLTARSYADGRLIAERTGGQPLGDIFSCLPWWIDHIGGVRAGDVVTTGTWNGMHWVESPANLRVEFVGLGHAEACIG